MSSTGFSATDGMRGGGAGEFDVAFPLNCNIRLGDSGAVESLDILRAKFENHYKAGLFQNDISPGWETTLSMIEPCNFSGYSGLQTTFSWSAAVVQGQRAITRAHALTWIHDGGVIDNWVYGLYVVDAAGNYQWAERFCPGPLPMRAAGQRLRTEPTFAITNEFRG